MVSKREVTHRAETTRGNFVLICDSEPQSGHLPHQTQAIESAIYSVINILSGSNPPPATNSLQSVAAFCYKPSAHFALTIAKLPAIALQSAHVLPVFARSLLACTG